jgi:hypothetical protein
MTVREQETLLRALDLWRVAVGQMTWEERTEASLALLIVRDEELVAALGPDRAGRNPMMRKQREKLAEYLK